MAVPEPDRQPGGAFTGWRELEFAVRELQLLAARLGTQLAGEDDQMLIDSGEAFRAIDLYERALADVGTLAGRWVELKLRDKYQLGGGL